MTRGLCARHNITQGSSSSCERGRRVSHPDPLLVSSRDRFNRVSSQTVLRYGPYQNLPIHWNQPLQAMAMEVQHRPGILVEGFSRGLEIIVRDENDEYDQLRTDFIESRKERSREMAAEISRIEAYFTSTRSARSLDVPYGQQLKGSLLGLSQGRKMKPDLPEHATSSLMP